MSEGLADTPAVAIPTGESGRDVSGRCWHPWLKHMLSEQRRPVVLYGQRMCGTSCSWRSGLSRYALVIAGQPVVAFPVARIVRVALTILGGCVHQQLAHFGAVG